MSNWMMKTTLERAFELARSGKVKTIREIERALLAEGYPHNQLIGPALLEQLRKLMKAAGAEHEKD